MKHKLFLSIQPRSARAIGLAAGLTVLFCGAVLAQTTPAAIALEGFETPALAPNGYKYFPTGGAWTFGGTSGNGIQRNGSAWGAAAAPEGQQTAFLEGSGAKISKVITLPAGVYNVSFHAARRAYGGNVANPIQVKINGIPIGAPIAPAGTAFAKYSTTNFPLSSTGQYTLELSSTVAGGGHSTFVDAVALNPVGVTQPPVATLGMSPACADFYAASPGFALNSARTVDVVTPSGKPAKGVAFTEPAYKTCVVRATAHTADGVDAGNDGVGFARNDYSRRQAFNSDNTKQLIAALNGYWHVYDANTHAHLKKLSGPAGDAEPQWHPTNPDLVYYLPTRGIGMQLYELNVSTGAQRTVGDFSERLKAKWPTAMAAWTRAEGSPSADGRYWCFMVDGDGWNSVGVFTWDRDTNTILGSYNTNGDRPDHVSMSPSGKYCVVSGDGPLGTVAFTRDFSHTTQVLHNSQHSDIALDANGDDVYVGVDERADAEIFMVNLRTGVRTMLMPSRIDGTGTSTAVHISGKAFNKPGWFVLTSFAEVGGSPQWMHRKVMAVQTAANPNVYNLAFHRSSNSGYWTAPLASVNREFTKVAFNSNWGSGSETDVDTYVIEIPAGSLKDIASSTPTPTPPTTSLAITILTVTRADYSLDYKFQTNQAAKCRASWSSGNAYAALYDDLASADGLTHTKTLLLGTAGAQTVYAVCKANSSTAEKEVAIQIN